MDYVKLSKEVSYALRHAPWEYELELDSEGFVLIDQLLGAINESGDYERKIVKDDLLYIIENSDKRRHEIIGDKIRALYGHSVPNKIEKIESTPPVFLFHGTAHKFLESIMSKGLLPMNRQYVHLAVDIETATKVGKRRDNNPVILKIDSEKAVSDGVKFYQGNDKVWLCDAILPEYITILK